MIHYDKRKIKKKHKDALLLTGSLFLGGRLFNSFSLRKSDEE